MLYYHDHRYRYYFYELIMRLAVGLCACVALISADFRVKFDVVTTDGEGSFTVLVHEVSANISYSAFVCFSKSCCSIAPSGLGTNRRSSLQGGS